ncbi:hypothetical protein AB6D11_19145 [Vibrio splendidus]
MGEINSSQEYQDKLNTVELLMDKTVLSVDEEVSLHNLVDEILIYEDRQQSARDVDAGLQ